MNYRHVVVGGTFDRLHYGHQILLARAFEEGERVTIGLTSDTYVKQHKQAQPVDEEETISGVCCPAVTRVYVQSYADRKRALTMWCKDRHVDTRMTIVPLHDPFGPTLQPIYDYDAIVVSSETRNVARLINNKRKAHGLSPLHIITIPMIPADDFARISSTRIRNGEIDEVGRLLLPHALRSTLTKPIGTVIPDKTPIQKHGSGSVISIGDTTTAALLTYGIIPTLSCIDFSAKRHQFFWKMEQWEQLIHGSRVQYFTSGPGYISGRVIEGIQAWVRDLKQTLFVIEGEEDLLVLPAVLYAPSGSRVYYGQPDKGIIEIVVTKEKKQVVRTLLSRFTHT